MSDSAYVTQKRRENSLLPFPELTLDQVVLFWSKVQRGGQKECWPWMGAITGRGYGNVTINYVAYSAHRVSFIIAKGSIPTDGVIAHRCDNRRCCNPNHLFLTDDSGNVMDMVQKGRGRVNHQSGEQNASAKLTEEKVRKIRSDYANGKGGYIKLGKRFNVSPGNIRFIVKRKIWTHITAILFLILPVLAQEATVQLQCNVTNVAADGVIIRWGYSPMVLWNSDTYPLGTNFAVSNVDLSTPEFFQAAYYTRATNVLKIGSGTNTHAFTNTVSIYPWSSPPISLYTPDMELSCYQQGNEIVVCWWGEAGYGYKLFAGTNATKLTNEVCFEIGTNGACLYSEPITNGCRFFKTNIVDEPAG